MQKSASLFHPRHGMKIFLCARGVLPARRQEADSGKKGNGDGDGFIIRGSIF